jgi:hypothetical protein
VTAGTVRRREGSSTRGCVRYSFVTGCSRSRR